MGERGDAECRMDGRTDEGIDDDRGMGEEREEENAPPFIWRPPKIRSVARRTVSLTPTQCLQDILNTYISALKVMFWKFLIVSKEVGTDAKFESVLA